MKRQSLPISSVVLAMILSVCVGCAKKLNDAQMSSDIQSKFSQDSGLSSKQLTVQASNGVVTLSGMVDNEAQRDAAAKQAASVPGVTTVINNLQVGDAAMAAAATPQKPTPVEDSSANPAPTPEKPKSSSRKRAKDRPAGNSGMSSQEAPPRQIAANNPPANAAPSPPSDSAPVPPPPPPAPKKFIIDQGTQLSVRLVDGIDSEKNQVGDTFHATLNAPLTSDGEQAVPTGVDIAGHVVDVKSAGKFAGESVVVLQLDSLTSGGKTYNLQTDQYRKQGAAHAARIPLRRSAEVPPLAPSSARWLAVVRAQPSERQPERALAAACRRLRNRNRSSCRQKPC